MNTNDSMPSPWVSLIIPMLNEAQSIEQTLTTLQVWRQSGAELIVVDGASQDDSVQLAEPLVDRVVESPRGRAIQMNAGADCAQGAYLMFVHADTGLQSIHPERFKKRLLKRQPAWGRFDVNIIGSSPWLKMVAFMMNWRSRLTGIATGDQCLFVQSALFRQLGGFPVQPLMEDIELCKQLGRISTSRWASSVKYGSPMFLRAKVNTSGRRWEANGVWYTIRMMWTLRWRYWRGMSAEALAKQYHGMRRG